ncbi:MAG: M3 family metallopeptidase [Muribaculaceae bacterium]|nr:M3 family metallopeptidase [Muribaculaceae bacterium]
MNTAHKNLLLAEYDTPLGTIPFNEIPTADILPAIEEGIRKGKQEIEAICSSDEVPDFRNTIVAYARSGRDLDRALNLFFPMLSAMSDTEMMSLSDTVMPLLSEYSTSITLNERLWHRIKAVYDERDSFDLDVEDATLLQRTYDAFARNGALLEGDDRIRYKELSARLSELTNKFGQNVINELNTYEIWLRHEDLDGLPETAVEAAAYAAAEKGREGEYLFTLAQPTYISFMKYSARRDLREHMYRLYTGRNIKGQYSNVEIIKEIASKRAEVAHLLGYKDYASYVLGRTMAGTVQNVYNLLDRLREAYRPAQMREFKELEGYARSKEGDDFRIMPWDYSFYSNKLKQELYDFDEEALRPYFELGRTVEGVFGLATKLYGIKFIRRTDISVYHEDVQAYEVSDHDGTYLGVIYTDFFPRSNKRPGAWMTEFKEQWTEDDGTDSRPHVSIVMNFTKPTSDRPSLLTPYEVQTFLHEFGHALHGLFSATKYAGLSGTNVYRDFVELPSQFNENFFTRREFLDSFARHYLTGEPLPQEDVDRIIATKRFGVAYACLRQLAFGYLDMAWHTLGEEPISDVAVFENDAISGVSMFPQVEGSLISPQFGHIFSGGYAAGYYSYKWAEVLDADAFEMFMEHGVFSKECADSFRRNILMKGGSENPDVLYRRFRGRDADIKAMMHRDGIDEVE